MFIVCHFPRRFSSDNEAAQGNDDRKSKKKSKKHNKSKKKSKKSKKSKNDDDRDSKKKKKKKKKKVSSSSDSDSSDNSENDDGIWVEKTSDNLFDKFDRTKSSSSKMKKAIDDGDNESQIGPSFRNTSALSHKDFGHALLPGEGAAMVCFI